MLKPAFISLLGIALIAFPAMAGTKKPRPELTAQVQDGMQAAQENLVRLKVKALKVYRPRLGSPRQIPHKG